MPSRASVVIDAGHGGTAAVGGSSSNSSVGPSGTLEKEVTLDLARRVRRLLGARGLASRLTRDGDVNLGLRDRALAARGSEVFVSLHLNGDGDPGMQGSEAWVHPDCGEESRALARDLLDAVTAATRLADRGVRDGPMDVLTPDPHRGAACLAELAYLTDPVEERRLSDSLYRERMAGALASGIARYLGRERLGHATVERSHEVREKFEVFHQVPLVPQLTGMSCWAAGAAMIIGWRDCIDVDAEELARGSGRWEEYREGLRPHDVEELARAWGLASAPALPLTVSRLRQFLEERGPLWVGEASPELHVIVVAGAQGDGTPDGTWVKVIDPWPVGRGERYTVPFHEFAAGLQGASRLAGAPAHILFSASRGRGSRWSSSSRSEQSSTVWRSEGESPRLGAPVGLLERYRAVPPAVAAAQHRAGRPSLLMDDAIRGYWTLPDGHVREWALPGALDFVTEPSGAPRAAGDPAAFRLASRRCVVYRDGGGALRLCARTERWRSENLGGAPAAAGDPQALIAGGDAWIFYRGVGRLHALRGGASGWTQQSTEAAGSDPAVWLSSGGPRTVHRSERSGHLVMTSWGGRCTAIDLSALAGAPPATFAPAAFADGASGCIAYRGADGRLHLLEGGEGRWSHADLHALAPAAPPAVSGPCAFSHRAGAHVVYRAADDHLHALSRLRGRWEHTDLIAAAGVSGAACAAGDPVGASAGGSARVFYVGKDSALHALALGGGRRPEHGGGGPP
ncbi:MAG TPA: N-acetylmuramoyl-L-alanine amidase [Myxococcales bacterium]|jgi:N-acetylmuramoyl-L-alanine amidase|nr:N-acetylmuramoyl-L-alanine amidase [Myxococcales bacterium]